MPLTELHRRKILSWYCGIFYALMVFKWFNGMLLYQVQPHLFNNRFDFLTWCLMKTGVHKWLLNNAAGWILFDAVFYLAPLLLLLTRDRWSRLVPVVAVVVLLVNWIYLQCYTLYPTNSIEGYTAWLLFPFLFMATNLRTYYFLLHGLRYFFLFFFASAGIWKLVQGGVFNVEQMSGVLLYQHKEYLASSPGGWYTGFIYWLINNPNISYCFYLAGTVLELCYIIGFFTRRYDKLLIVGFVLFLLFDILLMRIHYWEVSAFLITLLYSKYTEPLINTDVTRSSR